MSSDRKVPEITTDYYKKDNNNCQYKYKLTEIGISICSWNNLPCDKVPYNLCANHSEEDTTNE